MRRALVAGCAVGSLVAAIAVAARRPDESPRVAVDAKPEARDLTRHVPRELERACARAARRTALPYVACPPLVPRGPLDVNFVGRPVGARPSRASYVIDLSSPSIDRRSLGHWVLLAAKGRHRRYVETGSRPRPSRRPVRLGDTDATEIRMPRHDRGGGYYGGHVVIAWRGRGIEYHVSMHGHRNADLARRIAAGLNEVLQRCTGQLGAPAAGCRTVHAAAAP